MASGESKGSRRYDKENLLWQSTVAIKSDPVALADQSGISIIPIGPMTNWMSLRAALQFVCEQTGCVYEAGDGTVRIKTPKVPGDKNTP